MSKIMQNLVVILEPSEEAFINCLKVGEMILNRFCIDEDAAFELSGVYYLKHKFFEIAYGKETAYKLKRKEIGMEYSFSS